MASLLILVALTYMSQTNGYKINGFFVSCQFSVSW